MADEMPDVFDDAFAEAFTVALNQRTKEQPDETIAWLRDRFDEEMAATGHIPDIVILFSGEEVAFRHNNGVSAERAIWMLTMAQALVVREVLGEESE